MLYWVIKENTSEDRMASFCLRDCSKSTNFFSFSWIFLSLSAKILYFVSISKFFCECCLWEGGNDDLRASSCSFLANYCSFLANWDASCCLSFSRCLTDIYKVWHWDSMLFLSVWQSSSCLVSSFIYVLLFFWVCSSKLTFRLASSRLFRSNFFSFDILSSSLRTIVLSLSWFSMLSSSSCTRACNTFMADATALLWPSRLLALYGLFSDRSSLCLPSNMVIFCLALWMELDNIFSMDSAWLQSGLLLSLKLLDGAGCVAMLTED